jgi:hypothetical protein
VALQAGDASRPACRGARDNRSGVRSPLSQFTIHNLQFEKSLLQGAEVSL